MKRLTVVLYASLAFCMLVNHCWEAFVDYRPQSVGKQSVSIHGCVFREGDYSWRPGLTVRALVREAGGIDRFAEFRCVEVLSSKSDRSTRHMLHQWSCVAADKVEVLLKLGWEMLGLPGEGPEIHLSLPTGTKAMIDLRTWAADTKLGPGDVVIVPEISMND